MLGKIFNVRIGCIFKKCNDIPTFPSGIFIQCVKELVNKQTSQSLHHCDSCHCSCLKQYVFKSSTFTQQEEQMKSGKKKVQVRSAVHTWLLWHCSSSTLFPDSICRQTCYLPASPKRIIYLSTCKNHIILFHRD